MASGQRVLLLFTALVLLVPSRPSWVTLPDRLGARAEKVQRSQMKESFASKASGAAEGEGRRGLLAAALAFGFVGAAQAASARILRVTPTKEYPDGLPISKEIAIPDLAPEELERRRKTPASEVKTEKWYKLGKRGFNAHCSQCHLKSREQDGGLRQLPENLLSLENFEKRGGVDENRIQYAIRYGQKRMGGFAQDCGEMNDDFRMMCATNPVLDEQTLADIQDFIMNIAYTTDWKGTYP
mmetsp:Transcript_63754/g.113424  ORF Transcript_63754/g.113424 Transcript_63754/m.113424 type:complete len:240 (+) Transcript_63754:41-760(+)